MPKKAKTPSKPSKPYDFKVGQNYLVWTVTHNFTGRFTGYNGHELAFVDAAWIADSGRATQAFATGSFSEVEPMPDGVPILIGRGAVLMAMPVTFPLPRAQK